VEEEDSYFIAQGVAVGFGLAGCGFERDGEVSGVEAGDLWRRGKAEDVGGLVFAAKVFIETAKGAVSGEQDFYLAL
jgi:hypothetical protein